MGLFSVLGRVAKSAATAVAAPAASYYMGVKEGVSAGTKAAAGAASVGAGTLAIAGGGFLEAGGDWTGWWDYDAENAFAVGGELIGTGVDLFGDAATDSYQAGLYMANASLGATPTMAGLNAGTAFVTDDAGDAPTVRLMEGISALDDVKDDNVPRLGSKSKHLDTILELRQPGKAGQAARDLLDFELIDMSALGTLGPYEGQIVTDAILPVVIGEGLTYQESVGRSPDNPDTIGNNPDRLREDSLHSLNLLSTKWDIAKQYRDSYITAHNDAVESGYPAEDVSQMQTVTESLSIQADESNALAKAMYEMGAAGQATWQEVFTYIDDKVAEAQAVADDHARQINALNGRIRAWDASIASQLV